jgi:hypothetical protein
MIWSQTAPAQERELFLGSSNLLLSIKILKIRFGDTTKAFL